MNLDLEQRSPALLALLDLARNNSKAHEEGHVFHVPLFFLMPFASYLKKRACMYLVYFKVNHPHGESLHKKALA